RRPPGRSAEQRPRPRQSARAHLRRYRPCLGNHLPAPPLLRRPAAAPPPSRVAPPCRRRRRRPRATPAPPPAFVLRPLPAWNAIRPIQRRDRHKSVRTPAGPHTAWERVPTCSRGGLGAAAVCEGSRRRGDEVFPPGPPPPGFDAMYAPPPGPPPAVHISSNSADFSDGFCPPPAS
ncbi:hypothetical protein B0H14DRAFT_2969156, partial [Mycena olivaceomarginata]